MRILGRVLIAVGVLVSVGCGFVLAGLHSLSHYLDENPSPLSRGDAFTQALAQTALVATPGILIALFGWVLSRGPREPSERPRRRWWAWAWAPVALAAWAGAAWYISSITATPEPHQTFATGRDLTLREQSGFEKAQGPSVDRAASEDRAAHPVPAADLRRAERKLEARLETLNAGQTAEAVCERTYRWNISCLVELVDELGQGHQSSVKGHYVPQSRTVSFRPL